MLEAVYFYATPKEYCHTNIRPMGVRSLAKLLDFLYVTGSFVGCLRTACSLVLQQCGPRPTLLIIIIILKEVMRSLCVELTHYVGE